MRPCVVIAKSGRLTIFLAELGSWNGAENRTGSRFQYWDVFTLTYAGSSRAVEEWRWVSYLYYGYYGFRVWMLRFFCIFKPTIDSLDSYVVGEERVLSGRDSNCLLHRIRRGWGRWNINCLSGSESRTDVRGQLLIRATDLWKAKLSTEKKKISETRDLPSLKQCFRSGRATPSSDLITLKVFREQTYPLSDKWECKQKRMRTTNDQLIRTIKCTNISSK